MGNGVRLAVGLMSGTSMDGIDAALIETDGERHSRPLAFVSEDYDEAFRARLRQAMGFALDFERPAPHALIDAVEREQTLKHADIVRRLLDGRSVDVVGFHGQTIAHRPERGWTWQIGDGGLLAREVGATVVDDFRSADVAAGGHGAPFLPAYHRALAGELARPVAVLNLGGVGNLTWIGEGDDILAFDTGPGNALIDDWMRETRGASCDLDGAAAARGRVDEMALARLMDKDWFAAKPPKSLDRHDFSLEAVHGLSPDDGAATLTAFTAETVRAGLRHVSEQPTRLLVTGGGRRNPTLMRMLAERTGVPAEPVDSQGWNGDAMEAEGFAYLAVRALDGKALSWPGTTGVPQPMPGGRVHRP